MVLQLTTNVLNTPQTQPEMNNINELCENNRYLIIFTNF